MDHLYKRIPVIRDGVIVDDVAAFVLRQVIREINDPNAENFMDENRLHLNGHRCFDLLVDHLGRVICFSGMYHRDSWPEGFYRISNRTYVAPAFRTNTYNFFNPMWVGPAQIAETPDCKLAMISREKPKGKYYFRALQRRVPFYADWTISDEMVQVFPTEQKSSYQYVIYKSYDPYATIDQLNSISEEQWHELKD